ncbi:signal peptidase complex subunit 1-like [Physella acuta]|uniref:signal peptidase complex subunit 1-like n=1 Tax=Physella acuta TaxID=109671 RepID=UPI0027DB5C3D|nr:signal peptidase complex subunit 1-like [Physella acuta]
MEYILPFVPESIKSIPTHMDFDGQKRAERYFQIIIVIFAAVGFVWGYITQQFSQTLYILFAGVAVSSLLTLIPWSMYRQKPLNWQPVRDQNGAGPLRGPSQPQASNPSQTKSKKKKLKD